MILMTAVRHPAPVVAARHTLSGWEECTDASLFALLRDKLKSGKTEQAFELKDTQRLKKHVQQVGHACSSKPSPRCACFAPRAQAHRLRAGHRPAHREPVGCAVMLSVLPRLFLRPSDSGSDAYAVLNPLCHNSVAYFSKRWVGPTPNGTALLHGDGGRYRGNDD